MSRWGLRLGLRLAGLAALVGAAAPRLAAGGETAAANDVVYRQVVDLRAGQVLHAVAVQRGVDVALDLYDPAGRLQLEVDSPTGESGVERLWFVAPRDGRYLLLARRLSAAAGGGFTVTIDPPRAPSAAAGIRARACLAESEGDATLRAAAAGRRRASLDAYRRAMSLWRSLGDAEAEARAATKLGSAWSALGDIRRAVETWEQALALLEAHGLAGALPLLHTKLGYGYSRLGEPSRARASFEAALAAARRLGDSGEEVGALTGLAELLHSGGEPWDALVRFDEALAVAHDAGETAGEAGACKAQAALLTVLGQLDEAKEMATRAAALYERLHDPAGEGVALMYLGWARKLAGDPVAARRDLDRALALVQGAGDRQDEAVVFERLGMLARDTGRPADAVAHDRQALGIFHDEGDLQDEARTLSNLGYALVLAGDPAGGLAAEQEAIPRLTAMREPSAEGYALYRRGLAERALGRLTQARQDVELCLDLLDGIRQRARSEGLRMSYLDLVHDSYELLVDLLMDMHARDPRAGNDRAALAAAERGRARGLLDQVALARLRGVGEDGGVRRRLRQVDERIRNLQLSTAYGADGAIVRGAGEAAPPALSALLAERRRVLVEVEGPGDASAAAPRVLDVRSIQARLLDAGTVLLMYSLGEKRSFLWALTRDRLESAVLPPRSWLEKGARQLHDLLASGRSHGDQVQAELIAGELSRRLLAPVAALIAGRRLAIVPDGALAYLPFGALPEPGGEAPLLAGHELVVLPSASVEAAVRVRSARRRRSPARLAVVADPLLPGASAGAPPPAALARQVAAVPASSGTAGERTLQDLGLRRLPPLAYAREEAESILALVPPEARLGALGADASRDLVLSGALAPYAIVHFASHALIHPSVPELSGLALAAHDSEGHPRLGFLPSFEIAELRLPAELVVLSACSTGLGKALRGEGLVGLTQSFFQAGAARVLVSLWNVDDRATAHLMEDLYRRLLGAGRTPAAALCEAQLALRRDPRWAAPYYWAGFELEGDWRPLQ